VLISQIEEVGSDLGQPDCKLIEPFVVESKDSLVPWLIDLTNDNTFMISSDKILTMAEPTPSLLKKYKDLLE
jgi:hypothetical protein